VPEFSKVFGNSSAKCSKSTPSCKKESKTPASILGLRRSERLKNINRVQSKRSRVIKRLGNQLCNIPEQNLAEEVVARTGPKHGYVVRLQSSTRKPSTSRRT
jgi:hypothetical protein